MAALTSRSSIDGLVRWAQTELHAPEDTAALVAAAQEADAAQRAALDGPPHTRDASAVAPEEAGVFVPRPVAGAAIGAPTPAVAAGAGAATASAAPTTAAAPAGGAGSAALAAPALAAAAGAAAPAALRSSDTSSGSSIAQAPLPGLARGSSNGSGSGSASSRTGSGGGRAPLRLGALGSGVLRPLDKQKARRSVKFAGAGDEEGDSGDGGSPAGSAAATPSSPAATASQLTAAAAASATRAGAPPAASAPSAARVCLSPELEAVLRSGSSDPAMVARAAAEAARIASSASAPGAAARGLCTVMWDVGSCHLGTQAWESEDGHDHADDGTADLNGMLTSLKQQLITMGKYDARDRFEMAAFHDSRYFYQAVDDEERAQALSARRVDELCRNLVSVVDVGADADAGGNKMRARLTNVLQNIASYGLRVATVVVITGDASFEGESC